MQKSLLKQDSQFSILHPGGGRRRKKKLLLTLNSSSSNKIVIWKWTHGFERVTGTTFCTKTKQCCRACSYWSTPCYWRTNSVTLGEKCEVMCHPAPTLQIARKAEPNYDHTTRDTQAHMIRWNLPELSDLRYSSEAILPNRPPMSRNRISSLATHPGRVSSSSLIVSRTVTQPLISACALA